MNYIVNKKNGQAPKKVSPEEEKPKLWINAWYDPLANICVHSNCMTFSDINSDGDFKLLVANSGNNPLFRTNNQDLGHKLKVYKGTSVISENSLLEEPVAVNAFYTDNKGPMRPMIAISSGCTVFLYRHLHPYHKFILPPVKVEGNSATIGKNANLGKYESKIVFEEVQSAFPLLQQEVITATVVLAKEREDLDSVGCLVLCTESKHVYILNPSCTNIIETTSVPSPPVFVVASGALDFEYRIVVACRDCHVYIIKNKQLSGVVMEIDTHISGLLMLDKNILVGTISKTVHCFNMRGKRQYSIYLPSAIKCMEALEMSGSKNAKCLIVALENCELRVYNGKSLINICTTTDVVVGLKFGTYGREPNTLVLSYRNGGLEFKVVSRKGKFEEIANGGPPQEQEIPLNLPVCTKIYIDQVEREKKYSIEMHRSFQKELSKLRLTVTRAFVKILTDGQGPLSYTSGASIRLAASVQGLGPLFKIKLSVQNTGIKSVTRIPIIFSYNQEIYSMKQSRISIPILIPGIQYEYHSEISLNSELTSDGAMVHQPITDDVKIYVCSENSTIPLITAVVRMPIPELVNTLS